MTFIITIFFSLTSIFYSAEAIPFKAIADDFKNENAKNIVALGKEKTSISILEKDGVYSKTQGELVLDNFFKEHPVKAFKFIFKGKETGSSSFAIGTLTSQKEFRVTLKFKKVGTKFKIESITIEEN